MIKYPRTNHLEGSRFQPGDEELESIPFRRVAGRRLVIEEKMDGANAAIRFDADGRLHLQSRGHYLVGGARERHFDFLKRWAAAHAAALREVLGDRHVLYGEWLYAKHTIFYDRLAHYFLEFDVLDVASGRFLDTPSRTRLLAGLPIAPVPVLAEGEFDSLASIEALIGRSKSIGESSLERLRGLAEEQGIDPARTLGETDPTELMEGLYIKVEEGGEVRERYKFIRATFLQAVFASDSHWQSRPIVPNQLARGIDLFAASLDRP